MQLLKNILFIIIGITIMSCSTNQKNKDDNFKYSTEQFADLRIQRYNVPGF